MCIRDSFLLYYQTTPFRFEKLSKYPSINKQSTSILIIYGDHDAGSGGQRHNEFKSYLENMGYTVDTIHINSFILDSSIANQYNLLIIDRSCTSSHNIIKDTGKPILALGYGGGLFFTNALGFPSAVSQGTWYDNPHKILNDHLIFLSPNFIGTAGSNIEPVYYGSSWNGDGREYHFEISSLLAGSIALLDYYYDSTEYSTRTVLFAYNISSTQKTIFWGYDSYYPGGGGYTNCITNPLGLNLLENIVEYLKTPLNVAEITIENVQQTPLSPSELDIVKINASIKSLINISNARIYFSLNESPYLFSDMSLFEGTLQNGIWQGIIPNQSAPTNVTYFVYAEDKSNNSKKVGPFTYQVTSSPAEADTNPPELINISQEPAQPTSSDIVNISVALQDISGINTAQLTYQLNKTQNTFNKSLLETNFNMSNSYAENITIINNETIQLNRSGNYMAAFSFTEDPVGSDPSGWNINEPGSTHINVIAEKEGHWKVIEQYHTASDSCVMENIFTSKQSSSGYQIEFWILGDSNAQCAFEIGNGGSGLNCKIWMWLNFYANECRNVINGGSSNILITNNLTPNVWHHFRIKITGSLTFEIWIDQIYYGVYNGFLSQTTFDRVIFHRYTHPGPFYYYIDAVDFSWAPNYYINRNYNQSYYSHGFYVSKSYDLGNATNYYYKTLNFGRMLNPNSNITLEYRTSSDNNTWSSWSAGYTSNISIYSNGARYFQFRLNLSSSINLNSTAQCFWVNLTYQLTIAEIYTIDLNLIEGTIYNGKWNGSIPSYGYGTAINYYINVSDQLNNWIQFPKGFPTNWYGYTVGIADLIPPLISNVSYSPLDPTYNDSILIETSVNMTQEVSGLKNVTLCYSINNQNLFITKMNLTGNAYPFLDFDAIIAPPFSYADIIYFNITSYDFAGNAYSTSTYNLTIGDRFIPELEVSHTPLQPDSSQNVEIIANVKELGGASGVQNVTVYYISNETAIIGLDSPHPVPNLFNYTWKITVPDCYRMELFFENISLEENCDYLYVYNETYGLIQQYTGDHKHIQLNVMGNTTRIRLQTDFSLQSWGFSLAFIKFYYLPHMLPMTLSSGDIYNGSWSASIPQQANITSVYYYCKAFDLANNSIETSIRSYLSHEKVLPTIIDVTKIPNNAYITPSVSPEIITHISDNYGLFPTDIVLQYSVNNGAWINVTMNPQFNTLYTLNGFWNASIPAFAEGNLIIYRVIAKDIGRNLVISNNYSYFIDGTPPSLDYSSQSPLLPQYNDSVTIKLKLTDLFPTTNGAGISTVKLDYYYSIAYIVESDHPYPNNYNHSWIISYPSASGIAVHFTQITLSAGDVIEIYDGNGQHLQTLLGTITNQWSQRTFTNSIEIRLITNSLDTNYGFLIDQYRVYHNSSLELIDGTIYKGIWRYSIPPFPYGTTVWYDITATDKAGNSAAILSNSYTIGDSYHPEILSFSVSNENPTPSDDVNITLTVIDSGSGIKNITLWISLDGGITWLQVPLINISNTWYITIPRQPDHTIVKYFIYIFDASGNILRNPETGFYSLEFVSIPPSNISSIIELIILIIGMAAAVTFMLFLRSRSRLKAMEESHKRKGSFKSIP